MAAKVPQKFLLRQDEITAEFLVHIEQHLDDLLSNRVSDMFEIRDIADLMHIHPTHLSNTIKVATGQSPCYFFERRIMDIAKEMLRNKQVTVASIAIQLTFDPSNFVKFFKRFEGITPGQYRKQTTLQNTETVTIN